MSQNQFDRIPDDLLRLIINRVHDAKSLCSCLAVSTRFNSLAIHSTNISLSVDRIHFDDDDDESASKHNLVRSLFKLFVSAPLRFLTRLAFSRTPEINPSPSNAAGFYSPSQALKSFSTVEMLKIQLPSHEELQLDRNPLLKWKASFGSELKSCVIVAGTSVEPIRTKLPADSDCSESDSETSVNKEEQQVTEGVGVDQLPPFAISNEELKARVVWTISCLIAAASRHHLLKRIVAEHPKLKEIEMVDEKGQGTLTMNEMDISEMRRMCDLNLEDCAGNERSRIPAVKMKMWHAAEVELPECGKMMKGATLVVIGDVVDRVSEEEMFGEVAREIRKKMKQSYSLEMESF